MSTPVPLATPGAESFDSEKEHKTVSPSHEVAVHEVQHKSGLTTLQRFRHWITDRDYHVWVMSLGFTLLFISYPIQGVQTIRRWSGNYD